MLERRTSQRASGFKSIFKSQSYLQTSKNSETNANKESSDGNITDSSSISTGDPTSEQENQISPIRISGYSSDENKNNKNNSYVAGTSSYFLHNSNKTSTAKKRRRRPVRKPLAKVKISREPRKLFSTVEPQRVLKIFNSPAKEQNRDNVSQWNKVRNAFQILEDTPKSKCQNNSTEEMRQKSQTPPCCVDNITEENIEWSSSSSASEASFGATKKFSQIISTPSTSSQASNPPTELDLLLALIERESNIDKRKSRIKAKKRCRKGGYLQELLRTLEAAKTDRKYLEHDKKFGLQSGVRLTVMEMETSFGVHFAIGKLEGEKEDAQQVRILLDAELAKQVKVGSNLEAFFTDSCGVFTSSGRNCEAMPTYVQPHRLLLL